MHFEREHEFDASVERVALLMSDPDFQGGLDLPDLSRPEVVDHRADGTTRVLQLRYEYVGQLDAIAQKVLGGRKLTWRQDLRVDVATGVGTLSFAADGDAGRVNGDAAVTFTTSGRDRCRRRIEGDFRIRIPLVGATAERRIVPGLLRRLDVEGDALAAALRG